MAHLGNPQHRARQTLSITGTNGKGSVASMVSAAATAAGRRVGLFTSPHLVSVTERFRLNDRDMTWEEFDRVGQRVLAEMKTSDIPLSFFEAMTAIALTWFAEQDVDVQIVEVGLGGARDATAVCNPTHAVLTGVSLDHVDVLGPTLRHIAQEKLSLCRRAADGVYALPPRLQDLCPSGALVGRDVHYWRRTHGLSVRLAGQPIWHLPQPALAGSHQHRNAAMAAGIGHKLGLPLEAIQHGVAHARWPGRLQRLSDDPVVWLDGAHNPAAIAALIRNFSSLGLEPGFSLVFGAGTRKDVRAMAQRLGGHAGAVWCTTAPRLLPAEAVAPYFENLPVPVSVTPEPRAALQAACQRGEPVLIVGSLYLAGAILASQ